MFFNFFKGINSVNIGYDFWGNLLDRLVRGLEMRLFRKVDVFYLVIFYKVGK